MTPAKKKTPHFLTSLGPDLGRVLLVANAWWHMDSYNLKNLDKFPGDFFHPQLFFSFFKSLPISPENLSLLFFSALTLTALGFLNPLGPFCTFIATAFIFGWRYNFGFFHWSDVIIPLSFLALTLAPYTGPLSMDYFFRRQQKRQALERQLFLFRFLMVYPFFAAGISKLRNTGWQWGQAENMKTILSFNYANFSQFLTPSARSFNDYILARPQLLSLGAYGVLALEVLSPLALWTRADRVLVPLLLLCHIGFMQVFGHDFLQFSLVLYVYWLPWEKGWVDSRAR